MAYDTDFIGPGHVSPWPNKVRKPVMASDDGTRVGAAVVSSVELWLHRPFAQRVAVTPELLGGVRVGSGVVAQLAAAGSSVVTAILPAAGVIDVLIDDVGRECGIVDWTEFTVD